MNEFEFDSSTYAPVANTFAETQGVKSSADKFDCGTDPKERESKVKKKKFDIGHIRRRLLPLGINLERANSLLGGCICLGVAEHMLFFFTYKSNFDRITESRITCARYGNALLLGYAKKHLLGLYYSCFACYICAGILELFIL